MPAKAGISRAARPAFINPHYVREIPAFAGMTIAGIVDE
jgi:hypothetical protein